MSYHVIFVRDEKELVLFTTDYLYIAKAYCEEMNEYREKTGVYITRDARSAT